MGLTALLVRDDLYSRFWLQMFRIACIIVAKAIPPRPFPRLLDFSSLEQEANINLTVGRVETKLSNNHLVAICGKSRMAVEALYFIHFLSSQCGFEVQVVPGGGDPETDTWQPSLQLAANRLGVPIVSLDDLKPRRELILLSLEYDRILRTREFASGRLYNVHLSALPAYRGCYTGTWPILNGERSAGVTLHEVTDGIDEGPIVAQTLFPLPEEITARELYHRLLAEGARLLFENFPALLDGTARSKPQEEARATYYRRDSLDLPQAATLAATLPSETILRAVRAYNFPEYQVAQVLGRGVVSARVIGANRSEPVGTILATNERYFVCVVGDGAAVQFTLEEPARAE